MVNLIENTIGNLQGKKIAILGFAYRAGVKEHAFSGAKDLAKEIQKLGAFAQINDPLYSDDEIKALGFEVYKLGEVCDAVILHTNHIEYQQITPINFPGAQVFIDGRNSAPKSI